MGGRCLHSPTHPWRSLEAIHSSSSLYSHSIFSSPLLSIPTSLALVYTPRITAVASLLHLGFCFTLPHQPSALLTECYPQKTSELFTPLLKVLRGFPQNFQILWSSRSPPHLAPALFSTVSVPTLPPQTLPKHGTSAPWSYLLRGHALCSRLSLHLA